MRGRWLLIGEDNHEYQKTPWSENTAVSVLRPRSKSLGHLLCYSDADFQRSGFSPRQHFVNWPSVKNCRYLFNKDLVQSLSCVRLCDPMDCSTPGFPTHHQLPELTQMYVHRVGEAIQLSEQRLLAPLGKYCIGQLIKTDLYLKNNISKLTEELRQYWSTIRVGYILPLVSSKHVGGSIYIASVEFTQNPGWM